MFRPFEFIGLMCSLWTLNVWWFLWFYCNQFCKVYLGSLSVRYYELPKVLNGIQFRLLWINIVREWVHIQCIYRYTIDCQHYILRALRFTNTNFWKQDHAKKHHITCRSISVEEIFWSSRSWTIWLASCWYSATTRQEVKGRLKFAPQYMNFCIAPNASIDPIDDEKAGKPVNRLSEAGDFAAGCMGSTMEIKWFRQQYPGNRAELLVRCYLWNVWNVKTFKKHA